MEWVYLIFAAFYSAVIFYFFVGLFRTSPSGAGEFLTVSVLVPARNEAPNIGKCLQSLDKQTYHRDRFEVVVIDDQSSDSTAEVVQEFIRKKPNFKLLRHKPTLDQPTFKKQALKFALQQVKSDIVMTIDADTIAQPDWIMNMVAQYDERTGLLAGLVTFLPESEKRIFHKLQTLEFAGIVFCGMGSAANNRPIMCNGSNLSYRRKAFEEVGGYDGHLHLPSGDDDLLMQNIHSRTDWQVKYSLDPKTINYTTPVNSVSGFLNQRARWASKSIHYPSKWISAMLFSIYLFYLQTLFCLPAAVAGFVDIRFFLIGILLKMVPEFLIILKALKVLNRLDLLSYFLLGEVFQVPYILYAGLMGFLHKYSWKDRKRVIP
ncbi:MAG TPA: glycosyltransferase [Caldithrix sp.]|nr:glycosyltransferase [Caldithrix sp.]